LQHLAGRPLRLGITWRVDDAEPGTIILTHVVPGTPAARAWLIASSVCGITPSSAATTSTAMSVTLAPRARMAVNASWPGVSTKVIARPSLVTR